MWVSIKNMSSDKDGGVKIEKDELSSERWIKFQVDELSRK